MFSVAYVQETMLVWRDGIVRAPCKHEVREIPQRNVWSQSLWITRKGDVWKRVFNPVTNEWSWSEKVPLVLDDKGARQGLRLPHSVSGFVPVNLLIAMAWRRRVPYSETKVHETVGQQPSAVSIRWDEEQNDFVGDIPGEVWRPLEGKIGLVPINPSYSISDRCRLKNGQGDVTAGHWWDGRMWAAVKGSGLLDLTAAAKRRKEIVIPPSIERALSALRDGVPPSEYAKECGMKVTSAWSAYTTAAPHLNPTDLRRSCRKIVPQELWNALTQMKKIQNPVLGESLTDLVSEVDNCIPNFSKSRLRFEHLRLARMGILA
jgi:hypothetical protein